jgi:hypothetical protein
VQCAAQVLGRGLVQVHAEAPVLMLMLVVDGPALSAHLAMLPMRLHVRQIVCIASAFKMF